MKKPLELISLEIVSFEQAEREERERLAKSTFLLCFNGHRIPFETLNEASGIICELRRESGMGTREFGTFFPIVNEHGEEVAFVSYNGRVFEGKRAQWKTAKCVFDPAKDLCAC